MKKIFFGIIISATVLGSILCQEISFEDLPNIMVENSSEWENLAIEREIAQIRIKKSKWQFFPDFYLSPQYNWQEGIGSSYGIQVGGNWWLPTDGNFSIKASDQVELNDWNKHVSKTGPRIQMTYSQPIGVNGRFIDPSIYRKTKIIGTLSEFIKSDIAFLKNQNELLFNAAKLFSQVDKITKLEILKKKELELKHVEFEFLSQKKEQGGISGNDFWNKQMEISQLEDLILEISFQREEAVKSLCNILGVENWEINYIEPPKDFPGVRGEEYVQHLSSYNPELRLLSLSRTNKEFLRDIQQKENAGRLSFGLILDGTSESDGDFPFANFGEDGLRPRVSISYSTSLSSMAKSIIDGKRNKEETLSSGAAYYSVLKNKQMELQRLANKRKMLKAKSQQIIDSIEYLKQQVKREEQMYKIQSTTKLSVDWAKLNYLSRVADGFAAEWEIIINRLEIACMIGEDLSMFFDRRSE